MNKQSRRLVIVMDLSWMVHDTITFSHTICPMIVTPASEPFVSSSQTSPNLPFMCIRLYRIAGGCRHPLRDHEGEAQNETA